MIAFIILSSVFGVLIYIFIGGVIGRYLYDTRGKRCCDHTSRICSSDHESAAVVAGIFWPGFLPMAAGSYVGSFLTNRDTRSKAKADKAKLAHDRKMAELKAEKEAAEAATRLLEDEGWKVRVEQ